MTWGDTPTHSPWPQPPRSKRASGVRTALRSIARPPVPPIFVSRFSIAIASRLTSTVPLTTWPSLGGDRELKLEAWIAHEPVVAAEHRLGVVDAIERARVVGLVGRQNGRERTEHFVAGAPLDGDPTRIAQHP